MLHARLTAPKLLGAVVSLILATLILAACSGGGSSSSTVGTETVQVPTTVTNTATVTAAAAAQISSLSAASAAPGNSLGSDSSLSTGPKSNRDATQYLAGDTTVDFPPGDQGQITVVAKGPRKSSGAGTSWPIVVRNNTDRPVCDVKGTASATSKGKIVGSADIETMTPTTIGAGQIGYGYVYFDTTIADATADITIGSKAMGDCYAVSAIVEQVNVVPSGSGSNFVGRVRAPDDAKINGPISVDILCMDSKGQPTTVDSFGFLDQDNLAPGQSGTFSVSQARDTACEKYLVGASGYSL